ncbi:MAG: phosphoribosylanthranilate isomerase [Candidatus Dormiibacterota bacterium]
MTLVKICGIGDRESALTAADAGADLVGFHFCESSRRIDPALAREIVDALDAHGRRPHIVGVFIDPDEAFVGRIVREVGLDLVQLHGREAPGFRAPKPIVKALKVRDTGIDAEGLWPDPVLLDSWSADGRGGTGRTWRWDLAGELARRRRVILAGGLTPGNVAGAVRALRPYGVDVSSGVEAGRPGHKDPQRVRDFVDAVRSVDATVPL